MDRLSPRSVLHPALVAFYLFTLLAGAGCGSVAKIRGTEGPNRDAVTIVDPDGERRPGEEGDRIKEDETLEVPPDSRVYVEQDETEIVTQPDTEINFQEDEIEIKKGEAFIVTDDDDWKGYKTPVSSGGRRGTEFNVFVREVGGEISCLTTVVKGVVWIAPREGGTRVTLSGGEEADVVGGTIQPKTTVSRERMNLLIDRYNRAKVSMGRDERRLVPQAVGMPAEDAISLVRSVGLKTSVTPVVTGTGELGTISAQRPNAGTRVKKDSTVRLQKKVRAVRVPGLEGLSEADARAALRRTGLGARVTGQSITGRHEKGRVNAQRPGPGATVPEESTVELTLEAESVVVPDLRGASYDRARSRCRERRLEIRVGEKTYSTKVRTDTVRTQSAEPGTRLAPGSSISVTVEAPGTIVPDLSRQTVRSYPQLLSRAGLEASVRNESSSTVKSGYVIRQDPRPSTLVPRGSKVRVYVSTGPRLVTVPNVVNLPDRDAYQRLQRDGLSYRVTSRSGDGAPYKVYKQNPPAGRRVREGTRVDLQLIGTIR